MLAKAADEAVLSASPPHPSLGGGSGREGGGGYKTQGGYKIVQSGARGGFMEDKGAAASGVEVTGEGGKRTRGGENTESTCHWESQKSGNQKCCQKQHQQLNPLKYLHFP